MAVCPSDTQSDISCAITNIILWPPDMGWAQWDSHCGEVSWQNPSAPASWQQPPFPSLIPLLPASLGIRNIFLWYEHRWHGKANCRGEGDWQCVFMCVHLHSPWGYCWQTADLGDQRAPQDLSCLFVILSICLLSLQTINSSAKTELQKPLWWSMDAG